MPDKKASSDDRRRKSAEASKQLVTAFARVTRCRDGYDDLKRPRFVELFEVEDD